MGSLKMEFGNVGSIARGLRSHPDDIPLHELKAVWLSHHDFILLVPAEVEIRCAKAECRERLPLSGATSVRAAGTGEEIHSGLLCARCASTLGTHWNMNNRSVFGCSYANVGEKMRFWFHEVRQKALISRVLKVWRTAVEEGKLRRATFRARMLSLDGSVWSPARTRKQTHVNYCSEELPDLPDLPDLVTDLITAFSISLPRNNRCNC